MKNLKKLISVILAVMMIMTIMPVSAAGAAGSGSTFNPSDIDGFQSIQDVDFEDFIMNDADWTEANDAYYGTVSVPTESGNVIFNVRDGGATTTNAFVGLVQDPTGADNKVVKIDAGSATESLWFKANHDGSGYDRDPIITRAQMEGKKLVYSTMVYIPADLSMAESRFFGTWVHNTEPSNYMILSGTGTLFPFTMSRGGYYSGTARTNITAKGIKGKWAEIKYVVDYSQPISETHSDTTRVYVDGKLSTADREVAFPNTDPTGTYDLTKSSYIDLLPAGGSTAYYASGAEGYSAGDFYGVGFRVIGNSTSKSVIYVDDIKAYLINPLTYTTSANFANYVGGTISLTFNQKIADGVTTIRYNNGTSTMSLKSLFTLENEAGATVTNGISDVKLSSDKKTITIKPSSNLTAGDYKLVISPYFIDENGQGLNSNSTERKIDLTVGDIIVFGCLSGFEDIENYDLGTDREIELVFNNDFSADLNSENIHTAFKVLDRENNEVPNLGVELVDSRTIKLQLKDLRVNKGNLKIQTDPEVLLDIYGSGVNLKIDVEVNQFKAEANPSSVDNYMPTDPQEITLTLSADAPSEFIGTDISSWFEVTDDELEVITGLAATLVDARTVKLELKDLAIGEGSYVIAPTAEFVDVRGRELDFEYTVTILPFKVKTAAPAKGTILNYVEGSTQEIRIKLSTATKLTNENIATAFVVKDEDGTVCDGFTASLTEDNITVIIDLATLDLGKGEHTIEATPALVDNIDRQLDYEYQFTVAPFAVTYESAVAGYVPGTEKVLEIKFNRALSDTTISNINNIFLVKNSVGLAINGLGASVSEDKKTINLQLKDLMVNSGTYTIVSKTGEIVNKVGEISEDISISLATEGTGSGTGETTSGSISSSGTDLLPSVRFDAEELLKEDFQSYARILDENWLVDDTIIPSKFAIQKSAGYSYADSSISIVNDPADPESNNLVLKNVSGYYDAAGNKAASNTNYHILQRNLEDGSVEQPPINDYTEIVISAKVYIEKESAKSLPGQGGSTRGVNDLLATAGATPFSKFSGSRPQTIYYNSNPTLYTYMTASSAPTVSTGDTGYVLKTVTPDTWHTVEIVYSLYPKTDGTKFQAYKMYVDGENIRADNAYKTDFSSISGILVQATADPAATAEGSVVVYYDDMSIVKRTPFRTHINVPATGVPEDKVIDITLTKDLDAESKAAIENYKLVTLKDDQGNNIECTVTFTSDNKIRVVPKYGLKYQTEYVVKVPATYVENGNDKKLKAADGEDYVGLTYVFNTAKGPAVSIADTSSASFTCDNPVMEQATIFTYNLDLSAAHNKDIIAAVATFNEDGGVLAIDYQIITAGSLSQPFSLTSPLGASSFKVFIWEKNDDGSIGRLLQLPDEVSGR